MRHNQRRKKNSVEFIIFSGKLDKNKKMLKTIIGSNNYNLGLMLNKYILWSYPKDQDNYNNCKVDLKHQMKQIINAYLKEATYIPIKYFPLKYYFSFKRRLDSLFITLQQMGYEVRYLNKEHQLKTDWRLAINLGDANVYETSILLHRNYSVPYIPGSAIKGITRHWSILELYRKAIKENTFKFIKGKILKIIEKTVEIDDETLDLEKLRNFSEKDIRDTYKNIIGKDAEEVMATQKLLREYANDIMTIRNIFGNQDKKGNVIFFDAFPIISEEDAKNSIDDLIVLDIMNVHYKNYYMASEEEIPAPGDWMDPTPISFLTVGKNIKFNFVLVADLKNKALLDKAVTLTIDALTYHGVGAKTAIGYGYFKNTS